MRLKLAEDIDWEDLEYIESPSFAESEIRRTFFTTVGFQHISGIDEALVHISRSFSIPRRTKWLLEELLENIEEGNVFLVNEDCRPCLPALEWEADEEAEDGGKWQFIAVTMGFFEHNLKWLVEGISRPNVSLGLDVTPVVGNAKSAIQMVTGEDLVTGEPVDRMVEAAGIVVGGIGKSVIKGGAKGAEALKKGESDGEISIEDVNLNQKNRVDSENELKSGIIGGRELLRSQSDEYANLINLNKPWSWKSFPDGASLTIKQKREIKADAIRRGLIPNISFKPGTKYPDFKKANLIIKNDELPKKMWKESDYKQFQWLDSRLPEGRPEGFTWHHSEIPGKMELVPFGVHNSINHVGGRSKGGWADAKR